MTYRVKKLIAFFLTLVMVFNIMPFSSFAEDGNNNGDIIIEDYSKTEQQPQLRTSPSRGGYTVNMQIDQTFTDYSNYYVFVLQSATNETNYQQPKAYASLNTHRLLYWISHSGITKDSSKQSPMIRQIVLLVFFWQTMNGAIIQLMMKDQ